MFNGAAYHPGTGALYVGMADHCAWYLKSLGPVKDWAAAAKLQAPRGWITAINSKSRACLMAMPPANHRCWRVWCRPRAACCSAATPTVIFWSLMPKKGCSWREVMFMAAFDAAAR